MYIIGESFMNIRCEKKLMNESFRVFFDDDVSFYCTFAVGITHLNEQKRYETPSLD